MKVLKSIAFWVVVPFAFALGWLAAALLCWPLQIGLQKVGAWLFIPHAAGTYRSLDLVQNATLGDFPRTFTGACSVIFMNMPIGFLILFWWLVCATILQNRWSALRDAKKPRRKAPSRARAHSGLRAGLSGACALLIATACFFVLCVPFLRQYEIVTHDAIYTRGFFDWHERAWLLSSLKSITVDAPSRGVILWRFAFASGRDFTMTAPDRVALGALLALPHVQSNVRMVGTKLQRVEPGNRAP